MGKMVKWKEFKRDWFAIIAIIFRIVLDWSYIVLSNSRRHSMEFALHFNLAKMILSYLAIILICLETYNKQKISVFFSRVIIFFTIIPISSVYCMRNGNNVFFLLTVLSFLSSEFIAFRMKLGKNHLWAERRALTGQPKGVSDNTNKRKKEPDSLSKVLSVASTLIAVAVVILMYKYNGLPNLGALNLVNVYGIRKNLQTTWFLGGLTSLTAMVIFPLGVAQAKLRSNKTQVLFWCFIQLCLFLWTGNKTWLFSIVLLLCIIVILERGYSPNILFLGVTALAFLPFNFPQQSRWGRWVYGYIFDFLNRRMLLDPAALKFFYYDYFITRNNPTIGLSDTIFARLFKGLNKGSEILNYPFIISTEYTGITSNAGTGMYGGDIANLGMAAFVIVPLFLILLSFLIEQANRQSGTDFTMLLFTYLSYSFNDQGIFSYFLGFKGVFLVGIVLLISWKEQYQEGWSRFRKLLTRAKNNLMRFVKNGAIHAVIGSFLTKFVSFFGSIFIVRFLTKSEYGILSYYENFINYFTILAGFGLASGLLRYMVLAQGSSEKKSCFKRALSLGTVWNIGLVIICVLFIFFFPHPDSFTGYNLVGMALTFCIPFLFCVNTCLSTLRAEFDYKRYALLAFLTTFIIIASKIFGAVLGGLSFTTWARLVAEMTCAIICIILVNKWHFRGVHSAPLDKAFIKGMDVYSIQIMLTDGLWAIFMLNDLFLLGQLSGSETIIAEYKVAYVIPANLAILTWAVGVFVAPYFTKHENEKDYDWVKSKFIQVLKTTTLLIGADALICFILAKPLILLLYGKEYLSSVPIMRILLLASFFNNGLRSPIANVLSAIGIQKLNLYVAGGGMILQIILDILLIPKYGGTGVAWSSTVVYLAMGLALSYIFWNKYYRSDNKRVKRA